MEVFIGKNLPGMLLLPSLAGEMPANDHRVVLCIGCIAFSVCTKSIHCSFGPVSPTRYPYLDLDMGDMSIYF